MNGFALTLGLVCLAATPAEELARASTPPARLAEAFGSYRSPLLFDDGSMVKSPADWARRREEIRSKWHKLMGPWPAPIEKPTLTVLETTTREGNIRQQHIRLEIAPGKTTEDAYLLIPEGKGPFPAVVVVFYEAKTGIGEKKSNGSDFAWQLAQKGFVTLSMGSPPESYYPDQATCKLQPLSYHGYVANTAHAALANHPAVNAKKIGIVGHSYGGKWAMFASCLTDRFAAAAWSDPGIVFDEKRGNVNYWEPWYLGFEPGVRRKAGIPSETNPRTGPYRQMIAEGRDLHELHALMAPRPFLVSGGSEDPVERWTALNHTRAVNRLLEAGERVYMTNRPGHNPTPESNAVLVAFFEKVLKP